MPRTLNGIPLSESNLEIQLLYEILDKITKIEAAIAKGDIRSRVVAADVTMPFPRENLPPPVSSTGRKEDDSYTY
jgi:hypothetical protein